MKKYIIFIFAFLSIICTVKAQSIFKIEYYIDTDPGYGLATDVPIAAGTPINSLDVIVPMNNISDGFHQFFARAKDENGAWSMVASHQFLKVTPINPPSTITPNIVKIEYYLDTDPGYGVATDVPITANTAINNLNINLPMTNIADGFHQFFARAKDANGAWSMLASHQFLKTTVVNNPGPNIPNIVKAEYFIDTDPGYGLGIDVPIQTSNSIQNIDNNVEISSLPAGTQKVFLRAKDENNAWSIVNVQSFTIEANAVVLTATPNAYCKNNLFKIKFTASGTFNSGNVFTAQLSNNAGSFVSPTNIGTLSGILSGTILATIPNTISIGNGYKIRVVSSNPVLSNTVDEENFEVLSVCANQIFTDNVAPTASGNYCTGSTIIIPYTIYGTFAGSNQFIAQLSDATGTNFLNVPSVIGNNTVLATIPDGLVNGDFYRFRIISTDPQISGNVATQYLRIRNSDQETILSSQSGNWNDPDVWNCSRLPASQRTVSIVTGQNITAPTNGTSSVKNLFLAGNLNFDTNPSPNSSFTIARAMATQASGTLSISTYMEIAATASITAKIYSSTDYDKIIVGGLADLKGTLNVIFDAAYVPTAGNSFTVLSYAGRESAFTTINLPTLSGGMTWETNYSATGLTFTIKPAVALPLELIFFTAKAEKEVNILTWKTANETNFSHFEVQKSENGKEFGAIGNVNSNESGFYNFIDTNPNEGVNYYKLKMIDLDGTFTFSKTISVNFEKNGYYLSVENPAKNGEIMVRSNYVNPSFTLLNSLGQKMIISMAESAENQHKIKAKIINNGIYFLTIESEGKVFIRKVLME